MSPNRLSFINLTMTLQDQPSRELSLCEVRTTIYVKFCFLKNYHSHVFFYLHMTDFELSAKQTRIDWPFLFKFTWNSIFQKQRNFVGSRLIPNIICSFLAFWFNLFDFLLKVLAVDRNVILTRERKLINKSLWLTQAKHS